MNPRLLRGLPALLTLCLLVTTRPGVTAEAPAPPLAQLRAEADALRPLFTSPLVDGFLGGVSRLPRVEPRAVWCDSARTRCLSAEEARALPDSIRSRWVERVLDERFYYVTRYGSPLAYARALEIAANSGLASVRGRRIVDFGYGTIGHLRLLAQLGADVHGIEVDPLLEALYRGDGGEVDGEVGSGHLTLHHGQWPAESALTAKVGSGFDLFLSKNTLKRGYIHPAEKVNPRMLVHLGVDDSAYVTALARVIRPAGLLLIYNLAPAPAPPGKPYIPWADGRCPFDRGLLERAGFEVLAFDRDDSAAARRMGQALAWDAGDRPMDLEKDLFATYTLARRR